MARKSGFKNAKLGKNVHRTIKRSGAPKGEEFSYRKVSKSGKHMPHHKQHA